MKGIYLTQEGKQEIENEIKNLEDRAYNFNCFSKKEILEEILSSAKILPVEESWEDVRNYKTECQNGVIIQSQQ